MGNRVWLRGDDAGDIAVDAMTGPARSMAMSNGLTSVVISVLAMAPSAEAATAAERRLAVQVAGRDQSVFGLGTVSFALSELAWPPDDASFDAAKEFVLRSVKRAAGGHDWHRLTYRPDRRRVQNSLTELAALLAALDRWMVSPSSPSSGATTLDGLTPSEEPMARCDRHGVFEHVAGCVVCNDVTLDDQPG